MPNDTTAYDLSYFHIETLIDFQQNSKQSHFQEAFGERIGNHLWERFNTGGFHILTVWSQMDTIRRHMLIKYLRKWRIS